MDINHLIVNPSVGGIFTTEKVHNISLRISLVALIYTSTIAFSFHVEALRPLNELEDEQDVSPGIFLDRGPARVAVDDEGTIFVSHPDNDVVSVIDGDTLAVSTIPVGNRPLGIAVDNNRNLIFVASSESHTVSVIEQTEEGYKNIANVTSGGFNSEDVSVEGNSTYVVNRDRKNPISIIRETIDEGWRNVKNISLEDSTDLVDVAILDNISYVGRSYSPSNHTVSVIEDIGREYRNITSVSVGFSPEKIIPSYGGVFVTNPDNDTMSIIGTREDEYRNVANVSVGFPPRDVFETGTEMYVLDPLNIPGYVSVLDQPHEFSMYGSEYPNIANITVGLNPVDITEGQFGGRYVVQGGVLYVTNFYSEYICDRCT